MSLKRILLSQSKLFIRAAKVLTAATGFALLITSCNQNDRIESLQETDLFTISYGNFEEQLAVADLNTVGNVRYGLAMRDGFFYIVDGEGKKTMELNSYGDLLTLFYNEDSKTADLINKSEKNNSSVHREIGFPFDYPGMIAVDSKKCIYTVCTIPKNRQELNAEGYLCSQTVLRFDRDGTNVDYIGQQGPGGTPFPLIKNIYTTKKDELVVICNSDNGFISYWFDKDGALKYTIYINSDNIPAVGSFDSKTDSYFTIENIIPDQNDYKFYVYVNYYNSFVDDDSMIMSGINYVQTLLYTLNCDTETFEDTVSIPPYEESVVVDYSKLTYKIPYDFMGITEDGWKYFIIKTSTGFNIEMLQSESQKILRRQLSFNHTDNLYYNMYLSSNGIIAALYLDKDQASVVWYRTDKLIDSILGN